MFDLDATYSLFPEISKQLSKFSTECHRFSFDVVFLPIHSLLNGFSKLSVNQKQKLLQPIFTKLFDSIFKRFGQLIIVIQSLVIYHHLVLFLKKILLKYI